MRSPSPRSPSATGTMCAAKWRKWKGAGYKPRTRCRKRMSVPRNHRCQRCSDHPWGNGSVAPLWSKLRPTSSEYASFTVASDDFFRVAGVPLIRGRYFASRDTAQTTAVALINQTMARQFWPGDEPIGKRFRYGSPGAIEPEWLSIVGVVGDTRSYGPESQTISVFFRPHRQAPWVGAMDLVIRANTDFAGLAGTVHNVVRSVDA